MNGFAGSAGPDPFTCPMVLQNLPHPLEPETMICWRLLQCSTVNQSVV